MTLNLSQVEQDSTNYGYGHLMLKGLNIPFTGELVINNEGIDTFLRLIELKEYLPIPVRITSNSGTIDSYNEIGGWRIDLDNQEHISASTLKTIKTEERLYEEFKKTLARADEYVGIEDEESKEVPYIHSARTSASDIVADMKWNLRKDDIINENKITYDNDDIEIILDDFEKYVISYDNGIFTGEMKYYDYNKITKESLIVNSNDLSVDKYIDTKSDNIDNLNSKHLVKNEYWTNGNLKIQGLINL